ncbi:MAG TPA: hypothetical protein VHX52_14375 [Steroidobacteraceae bacterium]|jgi:hypothetical protein|nr:hypothetical protein [Steroidobacteraceae bacterium]
MKHRAAGPDGMLTNQRTVAKLTGGGDGSTIDSQGRVYVTSGSVVDVVSPNRAVVPAGCLVYNVGRTINERLR